MIERAFLISIPALFFLTLIIGGVYMRVADARVYDSLVAMLETRQGISPGATRVLPDCGCTIRYVGTYVHGRRYTVVIDRLD